MAFIDIKAIHKEIRQKVLEEEEQRRITKIAFLRKQNEKFSQDLEKEVISEVGYRLKFRDSLDNTSFFVKYWEFVTDDFVDYDSKGVRYQWYDLFKPEHREILDELLKICRDRFGGDAVVSGNPPNYINVYPKFMMDDRKMTDNGSNDE